MTQITYAPHHPDVVLVHSEPREREFEPRRAAPKPSDPAKSTSLATA
jgi:hypothetical protein